MATQPFGQQTGSDPDEHREGSIHTDTDSPAQGAQPANELVIQPTAQSQLNQALGIKECT